jgi:hypothetical protein
VNLSALDILTGVLNMGESVTAVIRSIQDQSLLQQVIVHSSALVTTSSIVEQVIG